MEYSSLAYKPETRAKIIFPTYFPTFEMDGFEERIFMSKRVKTSYPGVFYRDVDRVGGRGTERMYYIVFKKDGKVLEEKVGRQYADDMTQARAARIRAKRIEGKRLSRKEIREQAKARRAEEKNRWTIDRLWNEYKGSKTPSKNLDIDDLRYNKYLKEPFGNMEPGELIPLDIDRVRIRLLKTRSPQSVKHVLALLKRIIRFGNKKNLSQGIAFDIELPRVNNLKTEDLSPEQLSRLLKFIEEDTHPLAGPIMKAALFTGMRRGELFKLRWEDVDFERGFIHIRDPKGGPDQVIPMNDPARDFFASFPRSESEYVFPGRDGEQRTNINQAVNAIKKKAGLPKNFRPLHGLRHVYASMLASSGQVDMYMLQKLLTHKDPRMTQRYAHLRDEAFKRAASVAGDIIVRAANGQEEG